MIAFRGKKKGCATPKMVSFRISYEHPRPFHMGVPTPPPPGTNRGPPTVSGQVKGKKLPTLTTKDCKDRKLQR